MKALLTTVTAIALVWLSAAAAQTHKQAPKKAATAAKKKSAPARKSTAARKGTSTASKRTTSSARKKTSSRRSSVTWRNRQMSPTADRYREIQSALVARGYLAPEEATGVWNQASIDALKRFQAEQNIDSSGKINSLSLIALGLGPKRDPAPVVPPKPPADPGPGQ